MAVLFISCFNFCSAGQINMGRNDWCFRAQGVRGLVRAVDSHQMMFSAAVTTAGKDLRTHLPSPTTKICLFQCCHIWFDLSLANVLANVAESVVIVHRCGKRHAVECPQTSLTFDTSLASCEKSVKFALCSGASLKSRLTLGGHTGVLVRCRVH